jgi:hypothetical protein
MNQKIKTRIDKDSVHSNQKGTVWQVEILNLKICP